MHLVLHVLAAAQTFEKTGQRLFKPHGLTAAQFNVLNLLAAAPAGLRASDLARALIVDPSNVTGLLKRMKTEGFLQEQENSADRRQHIVALAPKGRRVWQAAHRDYTRSLESIETALGAADRKTTERVLQAMIGAASSAK